MGLLLLEILCKGLGVQFLTGGELSELVPGKRSTRTKHPLLHEITNFPAPDVERLLRLGLKHLAGNRVVNLRGEQLPEHIIVIVSRRSHDMNLARVIRRGAALGPFERLILLHEVPPELV